MAIEFETVPSTSANNIDANFDRVKEALQDAVSREGTLPNQMKADLDMNGNDLLNTDILSANKIMVDGKNLEDLMQQYSKGVMMASQAEAEAGETNVKGMSPLRVRQALGYVSPENYPSLPTHLALQRALQDAADMQKEVWLRPGKTYLMDGGVDLTDTDIRLRFKGAALVRSINAPNVPLIRASYSITNVQDVTSVSVAERDLGSGNSTVCAVTVSDGSAYLPGDALKIVSDDLLPDSPVSQAEYTGEIFLVSSVEGNVVYGYAPLRETFSTNIRIGKMTKRVVFIEEADASDEEGAPTSRNAPLVQVKGSIEAEYVRPYFHDGQSMGLQSISSYKNLMTGARFERLRTSPSNAAYGYGFAEYGCVDGLLDGWSADTLRHPYTTGALIVEPGQEDIYEYGGTIGTVVRNGGGKDCCLDRHEDSLDVWFENCYIYKSFRPVNASFNPYNLRGRGGGMRGCGGKGPTAFNITVSRDGSKKIFVENHFHERPSGYTTTVPMVDIKGDDDNTGDAKARAKVYMDLTIASGSCYTIVRATNSDLEGSIKGDFPYGGAGVGAVSLVNSKWKDACFRLDASKGSGNNPRVALVDAASELTCKELSFTKGSGTWVFADFVSGNGKATFKDVTCDVQPSTANSGFANVGSSAAFWVDGLDIGGENIRTGIDIRGNSSVVMNGFSKGVQYLDAALTQDRTITEPSQAVRTGREILYVRSAQATGAFSWAIGNDSLTAASTWLRRKWTGSTWLTIAKGGL